MTYTILDIDTRNRLDRLCQLGARPRIIAAMLPSLPEAVIRAHWVHQNGHAPSKGPSTSRPGSYWATLRTRLHSSFALITYLQIEETSINFIDAYIKSYEHYTQFFARDNPEGFDWLWGLVRNYLDDRIQLIECKCCASQYIHNSDDLINDRNCPTHRYLLPEIEKRSAKPKQMETLMVMQYPASNDVIVEAPNLPAFFHTAKHQKAAY